MENNNYKKPTFKSLIHTFEYDAKVYNVEVDKETGDFIFTIYSRFYNEASQDIDYIQLYRIDDENYYVIKDLFFTFHKLVVPFEVKEEANYEDGSFEHPMKSGEIFEMFNK